MQLSYIRRMAATKKRSVKYLHINLFKTAINSQPVTRNAQLETRNPQPAHANQRLRRL